MLSVLLSVLEARCKQDSWMWIVGALLLLWPAVAAALRFRRVARLPATFGYRTRADFAKMTVEDAGRLQNVASQLEFPMLFELALQFALFRTYGIPTISKLLLETRQLADAHVAAKRYADTAAIIVELLEYRLYSDRATDALARLNYIHSHYRRAGKISNDDMLYTLALFSLEPMRWIRRHEWRPLSELEICAIGTSWMALGTGMEIDYTAMRPEGGFQDGLHWMECIAAWSVEYETKYMVPSELNRVIAERTVDILLVNVPEPLKPLGREAVSALMDDRLRTAMMYPAPSRPVAAVVKAALRARQLFLRYLALPRPAFLRVLYSSPVDASTGRIFQVQYQAEPWYVKPTLLHRWGPKALLRRISGGALPGDGGDRFSPDGFLVTELGPSHMKDRGIDFQKAERERILTDRQLRCPFLR